MGVRIRHEERNKGQESPYVGERLRHIDQSRATKYNLEDDGDHESQIRDGLDWTGIDGSSMAWDAKVVLEYRSVIESDQLCKTDMFIATFRPKFDLGILGSWLRHRKWYRPLKGENSWCSEKGFERNTELHIIG